MKKVIIPLPSFDFDPSEVAIPWSILKNNGIDVFFATPDGKPAQGDQMMLSGEGLDPWGWIPIVNRIKLIGLILRANKDARQAYAKLIQDNNFNNPCRYSELNVTNYSGLLLPGGHAPRMKPYLEDKTLQSFIVAFFESKNENDQHKPVAAVCHGVLLAARSISEKTGKSVLYGKKTTALTWEFENSAWKLTKYFARFWDPDYYRTYTEKPNEPKGYWGVEQEIKRLLENESDFINVSVDDPNFKKKTSGTSRDSFNDSSAGFVVQDGNYISARWPGDVHTLGLKLVELLNK
ncbi:MAG: thiJ/pfpI-family protein [Kangiella sp.]|nr:MAG: thiJ/pfpI-family protein [Kangiella sp.]